MSYFPVKNYREYEDFRFFLRTGITTYGKIRELTDEAKCQRKFKIDHVASIIGERISNKKNIGAPISIADLRGHFYVADGRNRVMNEKIKNDTPCRVDIYTVKTHEEIRELFYDLNNSRQMSSSMICFTSPEIYNILSEVARISKLTGAWIDVDREDVSVLNNKENYYNLLKYIMAYVKNSAFLKKPMETIQNYKKEITEQTGLFSIHMTKLASMSAMIDPKQSHLVHKSVIKLAWAAANKKINSSNMYAYFKKNFIKDYNEMRAKDYPPRTQVQNWIKLFSTM